MWTSLEKNSSFLLLDLGNVNQRLAKRGIFNCNSTHCHHSRHLCSVEKKCQRTGMSTNKERNEWIWRKFEYRNSTVNHIDLACPTFCRGKTVRIRGLILFLPCFLAGGKIGLDEHWKRMVYPFLGMFNVTKAKFLDQVSMALHVAWSVLFRVLDPRNHLLKAWISSTANQRICIWWFYN